MQVILQLMPESCSHRDRGRRVERDQGRRHRSRSPRPTRDLMHKLKLLTRREIRNQLAEEAGRAWILTDELDSYMAQMVVELKAEKPETEHDDNTQGFTEVESSYLAKPSKEFLKKDMTPEERRNFDIADRQ